MNCWTEERVEMLKKLWADGFSGSQIADRLGNVTRNAVIGKVHRLGPSGRICRKSVAVRPQRRKKRKAAGKAKGLDPRRNPPMEGCDPTPPAIEQIIIPPSERKTLLQLTDKTCKWPIGDPQDEDFGFCGRPPALGKPYCNHHARVAYQSVAERRKQRAAA